MPRCRPPAFSMNSMASNMLRTTNQAMKTLRGGGAEASPPPSGRGGRGGRFGGGGGGTRGFWRGESLMFSCSGPQTAQGARRCKTVHAAGKSYSSGSGAQGQLRPDRRSGSGRTCCPVQEPQTRTRHAPACHTSRCFMPVWRPAFPGTDPRFQ